MYPPSGFRTNHSTEFCLAQLIDFVLTGMNKQTHTNMILVDLQEAFDTLDHGIFLERNETFWFPAICNYSWSTISQTKNFWFSLIMFFPRLEH